MGKNNKEKQMLCEWGMKNCSGDIFTRPDPEKESYFLERPDDVYLREYQFDTLPDIMGELEALWMNDEIMDDGIKKVIGIAAMKNKPIGMAEEGKPGKDQEGQNEKLPMYIYNF